jgi:glyoxylase-like metal-dependent hydrolase (beta-lactamase superfamily II)
MYLKLAITITMLASCTGAAATEAYHVISGSVPMDKGPDGNSVILDAPEGLIVVDTGRHPEHSAKLLAYAKQRGKPIAAVFNTHWHLDHTTGNHDIREVYPDAPVYATNAIEGALVAYLPRGRERRLKTLADPTTPPDRRAQAMRTHSVLENPDRLRPTRPVTRSATMTVAGRKLDVRVAPFAASEADLWLYDPGTRTAIVGDLVVDIVPFMDSACPDGWSKALEDIAATPFKTLVPGHGPVMTKPRFLEWKGAFDRFVSCGRSETEVAACADGWSRDAASFIPETHRQYAKEAAAYYLESRFRSPAEERNRYCKPLLPVG